MWWLDFPCFKKFENPNVPRKPHTYYFTSHMFTLHDILSGFIRPLLFYIILMNKWINIHEQMNIYSYFTSVSLNYKILYDDAIRFWNRSRIQNKSQWRLIPSSDRQIHQSSPTSTLTIFFTTNWFVKWLTVIKLDPFVHWRLTTR